jgi:ADP-ribose pyrophosphatase YjhB (NUDIX family)/N-acetylglutamate synthase-like GNAT family acetyltransferase
MDVQYCPKCATKLEWRSSGDRERPACPACGFVFYFNPVVGAGALVETDGRVVLVRRGVEPKAGYWSLPSGYVEADELAEAAAVREMQEETGLEIEIDDLLGVYSFGHEPQTGVLILYSAHAVGGQLCAGDDAQQVGTFAPAEMPPDDQIAFRTHLQALHDWRRARAIVYRQAVPGDRPTVAALSERYRQVGEACLSCMDAQDQGLLLAWDRDQLVGLACVSNRPWSHTANLDQVFVCPGYRRWGIATRLVGQAIDYARQEQLRSLLAEAPVTNPVLLVYLKAGFRVSGFIDAYYPPGRDGPVTALHLAYDLT